MRSASLRGGAFDVLKHYIEQRAGTKTKLLVLSTAADITMLVQERQKFFKAYKFCTWERQRIRVSKTSKDKQISDADYLDSIELICFGFT